MGPCIALVSKILIEDLRQFSDFSDGTDKYCSSGWVNRAVFGSAREPRLASSFAGKRNGMPPVRGRQPIFNACNLHRNRDSRRRIRFFPRHQASPDSSHTSCRSSDMVKEKRLRQDDHRRRRAIRVPFTPLSQSHFHASSAGSPSIGMTSARTRHPSNDHQLFGFMNHHQRSVRGLNIRFHWPSSHRSVASRQPSGT